MMPSVTDCDRPKGLPIARARCPISTLSLSPQREACTDLPNRHQSPCAPRTIPTTRVAAHNDTVEKRLMSHSFANKGSGIFAGGGAKSTFPLIITARPLFDFHVDVADRQFPVAVGP